MKLKELIEHLDSELSQYNMGFNTEEGLNPVALKQILPFINLGLINLYSRFPIKTNWVRIRLYENITIYHLDKKYLQSNTESSEPIKYIEDADNNFPLLDRIIKIDQVFAGSGVELPVNNDKHCLSVFTPYANTIQVPCPKEGDSISVIYRAAPKKISDSCDTETDIDIPYPYLNALIYFILSKVLGKRDRIDSKQEGQLYMSYYEKECRDLENFGVEQAPNNTNTKFMQRGFV